MSKTDRHLLRQKAMKNTGVFVVFKTQRELKCQFSGHIKFSLQRFFVELFDIINDDLFLML